MCCHFIKRGYPTKTLIDAIIKVSKVSRLELLERERKMGLEEHMKEIIKDSGLFLITTYSPEFSELKGIANDNWDLLKRSSTTKVLAETKITFGYRCPPNLKDLLVRAKLPKQVSGPKRKTPH